MTEKKRKIALVGFGPRGLAALEFLARAAETSDRFVDLDIFDASDAFAAGPNFSPTEPDACLLNLPIRAVDLPDAPKSCMQAFGYWVKPIEADDETFVPRSVLGQYFSERFRAVMSVLPANLRVSLHPCRVIGAKEDRGCWTLSTDGQQFGPYDDVLFTLGQPKTEFDDQTQAWAAHAKKHGLDFRQAYPGRTLIDAASRWQGRVVAVRGLGLSALDVVRMLTVGLGGKFRDGTYIPSGREPSKIVPFSLDGHAPAPKPVSAEIDDRFNPTSAETRSFEDALRVALATDAEGALDNLCCALIPVAKRILTETGTSFNEVEISEWLETERNKPGRQEKRGTIEAIRGNLLEAEGTCPPSVGFTIGQIWRKWQPQLRSIYDAQQTSAETAKAIIGFDEGLKRFSYGAPVHTLRQLLCLMETGLVTSLAAEDPNINLSEKRVGTDE